MDIPRVAASAGEAAAGALESGKLARLVADFDRVGLRAPTTHTAPAPPAAPPAVWNCLDRARLGSHQPPTHSHCTAPAHTPPPALSARPVARAVVVENVVPERIVDQLQPRMLSDAAALAERRAWEMRDGSGNGHLQMGAPKNAPWVHPEVVSNPLIEQIATAVLGRSARGGGEFHPLADDGGGPIAWLGFFNGNCATPFAGPHAGNSGYQGLHTDGGWTYSSLVEAEAAGQPWPHLTTCLHINFCVVDVTDANGPEVWPGSHRVVGASDKARLGDEAFVAQRRAVAPPVRCSYPRGSICLKDCRIWHRGAPNTSGSMRPSVRRPPALPLHVGGGGGVPRGE